MLENFVVIENVFDDPEEVVRTAMLQTYLKKETHYHNVNRNTHYDGLRSRSIIDIDTVLDKKLNLQIFSKIFQKRFPKEFGDIKYRFDFEVSTYFHIMTEEHQFMDIWKHKDDSCLMAGVVYLQKYPEKDSGTIIYKDNGEVDTIIKNEYNKLVLYSSDYLHAPQRGFGTNLNDARLTMPIFLKRVRMDVYTTDLEDGGFIPENEIINARENN